MARKRIGDMTVREFRDLASPAKQEVVERVAALTGRSRTNAKAALASFKLNMRLCDAFDDWPSRAQDVRGLTASRALALDLAADLAILAPMSAAQMRKALRAAAPQTHASTILAVAANDAAKLHAENRERTQPLPKEASTKPRSTKQATTRMPTTKALVQSTPLATTRTLPPPTTKPLPTPQTSAQVGGFQAGAVIADYVLVRHLRTGGFGIVWLAKKRASRTLGGHVIKFPRPDREGARLQEEWDCASQLEHSNVCRPIEFLRAHGALVFKFAGQPIDIHLNGRAADRDTLSIVAKSVAAGLHHGHERQVLHLDLAPDNVLIDGNGVIRVSDYGAARMATATARKPTPGGTQVASRAVAFHSATAAPEMLMGHEVSHRSDVYGLAALLALLADPALSRHKPPPPVHEFPGLPPAFAQAIARGLEYDPQKRFPSVKALALAVERALR